MRYLKRLIWRKFQKSAMVRYISLGLVAVLLAISAYGLYKSFTSPLQTTKRVAVFNYQHLGRFDYLAHVKPLTLYYPQPQGDAVRPTIFSKIVDSVSLTYDYQFVMDKPAQTATEEVEVVAVLESPKAWRKEIPLVPRTVTSGGFELNFPLALDKLKEQMLAIDEEVGVRGVAHTLTILARVHVKTNIGTDVFEDDFQQTRDVGKWTGINLDLGEE